MISKMSGSALGFQHVKPAEYVFEKNNPIRVPVIWYFLTYVLVRWVCLFYDASLIGIFMIFLNACHTSVKIFIIKMSLK